MKRALAIFAFLCLGVSCKQPSMSEEFRGSETLHLEIKGYTTFTYDPLTCQKAYNADRREFRVSSDNMSDFYTVRLDGLPDREGQSVRGSVTWTTGDNIHSKSTVFETVRLDGSRIWLWSSSNRIAVVVEVLE